MCLVCLFLLSFLGDKYPWIDKFPAFNVDLKVAREVRNSYVVDLFIKFWKVRGAVAYWIKWFWFDICKAGLEKKQEFQLTFGTSSKRCR